MCNRPFAWIRSKSQITNHQVEWGKQRLQYELFQWIQGGQSKTYEKWLTGWQSIRKSIKWKKQWRISLRLHPNRGNGSVRRRRTVKPLFPRINNFSNFFIGLVHSCCTFLKTISSFFLHTNIIIIKLSLLLLRTIFIYIL